MDDVHVAALIEDLRGQFKVFGEALQANNDKIDALGERLDGRIDALGARLDGRIDALGARLDGRIDGLENKVDDLAVDMSDVKKRLGRVERALNGTPRSRAKSSARKPK
jgi:hypothetical protein